MRLVYVRDEAGNLQEQFCRSGDLPPREPVALEVCVEVLRRNVIGRVGFVRYDRPMLLPVTYALDRDGTIVFRSTRGSKLWVAENETRRAAFEVDEDDRASGDWVGVVVHGAMRSVTDLVDAQRLDRLDLVPWVNPIERPRWIRITPEWIEHWRLPGRQSEPTWPASERGARAPT